MNHGRDVWGAESYLSWFPFPRVIHEAILISNNFNGSQFKESNIFVIIISWGLYGSYI